MTFIARGTITFLLNLVFPAFIAIIGLATFTGEITLLIYAAGALGVFLIFFGIVKFFTYREDRVWAKLYARRNTINQAISNFFANRTLVGNNVSLSLDERSERIGLTYLKEYKTYNFEDLVKVEVKQNNHTIAFHPKTGDMTLSPLEAKIKTKKLEVILYFYKGVSEKAVNITLLDRPLALMYSPLKQTSELSTAHDWFSRLASIIKGNERIGDSQ